MDDNAAQLAAALAFYTLLSLAPALILIVALTGAVFGQEAARSILLRQIYPYLGSQGTTLIGELLLKASEESSIATAIGLATTLFAATIAFGALQDALNLIWRVAPKPGRLLRLFFKKRLVSFALILGIGLVLLTLLLGGAIVSALSKYLGWSIPAPGQLFTGAAFLLSFSLLTLLFAIIYKVLPDVQIEWRDVWLGAIVTASLFYAGKFLIGLYLGHSTFDSTYGAAGSLVVFMLWVYYSAQVFFFGGEFTHVYAKKYGSGIRPDENAVRVTRKIEIRPPDPV